MGDHGDGRRVERLADPGQGAVDIVYIRLPRQASLQLVACGTVSERLLQLRDARALRLHNVVHGAKRDTHNVLNVTPLTEALDEVIDDEARGRIHPAGRRVSPQLVSVCSCARAGISKSRPYLSCISYARLYLY